MQILYAVKFDLAAGAPEIGDPYGLGVAHLASWIASRLQPEMRTEMLDASGAIEGTARSASESVNAAVTWQVVTAASTRAIRLEVRQPIVGLEAFFVTAVTLVSRLGACTLRVVLGRDVTSDVLSPTEYDGLHTPQLIPRVLEDRQLVCRAHGQLVDTRYSRVAQVEHLPVLYSNVRTDRRLPLLVIDTVRREHLEVARASAKKLAGLVQVVCLPSVEIVRNFNDEIPETAIPFAGARLIWPTLESRHPSFSQDEVSDCVGKVQRLLGNVSAVTFSANREWLAALNDERAESAATADSELAAALARAAQSGDLGAEAVALRTALDEARSQANSAEEFVKSFQAEFDRLEAAARLVEVLQRERDYWREMYLGQLQRAPTQEAADSLPPLERDPAPLFRALEARSSGAVVFTPSADRSWRDSLYPRSEAMAQALIALADAASEWRDKSGVVGRRMVDWFKVDHSLNVSLQDSGLEDAGKQYFDFEGRTLERTPHVQLDQHVPPNEVGRIYFAMDQETQRFVVDHVGLKLYGL